MSIIVSNFQHCDEQQLQTLSCVHYTIFSVVKLRFIHTSTVTGSYFFSEKYYAYASRTSCSMCILNTSLKVCLQYLHIVQFSLSYPVGQFRPIIMSIQLSFCFVVGIFSLISLTFGGYINLQM